MEDTLHAEQRAARARAAPGHLAAHVPGVDANLRLEPQARAFETFIEGFPAYAPMLRRVKGELERALDAGVAAARDGLVLRARLQAAWAAQDAAVEDAYKQARAASRHGSRAFCLEKCDSA
jgi:hypothetical protein